MFDKLLVTPETLFLGLLAGILPATFWLWFWLKEDQLHPEPRGLLMLSFIVGMLATVLAFPIETYVAEYFMTGKFALLVFWAPLIEEALKFGGIALVALRTKYFDEPIDGVIYLVTIALGFAALENAVFLFSPLEKGDGLGLLALSNFRFIGATLLHVAASGFVGVVLALTFYQPKDRRLATGAMALVGAVVLHSLFNFSIIASEGRFLFGIFVGLWILIIAILLICEKIKRMAPRSHVEYPHTGIVINLLK